MEAERRMTEVKRTIDDAVTNATPTNSEQPTSRYFTVEEAGRIITEAEKLQRLAEQTQESITTNFEPSLLQPDSLSKEAVYKLAQDLSIPANYIATVISNQYPEKERLLEDLTAINATPSKEILIQRKTKHINLKISEYRSQILDSLNKSFPNDIFQIDCITHNMFLKHMRGFDDCIFEQTLRHLPCRNRIPMRYG